jgi:hypothetical protein
MGNSRKSANLMQLDDTSFRVKLPAAVADRAVGESVFGPLSGF